MKMSVKFSGDRGAAEIFAGVVHGEVVYHAKLNLYIVHYQAIPGDRGYFRTAVEADEAKWDIVQAVRAKRYARRKKQKRK